MLKADKNLDKILSAQQVKTQSTVQQHEKKISAEERKKMGILTIYLF